MDRVESWSARPVKSGTKPIVIWRRTATGCLVRRDTRNFFLDRDRNFPSEYRPREPAARLMTGEHRADARTEEGRTAGSGRADSEWSRVTAVPAVGQARDRDLSPGLGRGHILPLPGV